MSDHAAISMSDRHVALREAESYLLAEPSSESPISFAATDNPAAAVHPALPAELPTDLAAHPVYAYLVAQHVFPRLATQVVRQFPQMTVADVERGVAILRQKGHLRLSPVFVAARIWANGEQITPTDVPDPARFADERPEAYGAGRI